MADSQSYEDSGPIVNVELVKQWLYWGIIWTVIFPVVGLVISIKLNHPEFLGTSSWLTYGRLQPIHVNGAILGSFSTSFFGLAFYLLPKLTGIRMVGEKMGYWALLLWNIGIVLGSYSLAAGFQKGIELGDYALWADLPLFIAFFILTYMVLGTILKRKEKLLYVSLYYAVAAMVWTAINFPLVNILLPYKAPGVNNAALHGLYSHYIEGLWMTPAALALIYFFLPLAAKNPLNSHKLALVGFWSMAFFYPFVGIQHYLYSPIPNWTQTVAIVASIMSLIPVLAVTQNFFGTMIGNWRAVQESFVVKFCILGAIFYLLGALQASTSALRGMQQLTHFTDYAGSYSHLTIFGGFAMWTTAGIYYVWPRVTGHALWSKSLATWHFWLIAVSVSAMAVVLTVMGLVQGTMWFDSVNFVDTLVAMKPYRLIHSISGLGSIVGLILFALNMFMTGAEPSSLKKVDREKKLAGAAAD